MTELESPVYAKRLASGLYKNIASQIAEMGKNNLGAVNYKEDIYHIKEGRDGNIAFKNSDKSNFRTNIVGQICHETAGTVLCAKGNFYAGRNAGEVSTR